MPAPRLTRIDHAALPLAVAVLALFVALGSSRDARAQCFPDTLLATIPNPAPAANDLFGVSIAVSGNMAVVGANWDDTGASDAGRAYVFDATTGALVTNLTHPSPAAGDEFGISVAVSGNLAVVGAHLDDVGLFADVGRAFVFNATTGAVVWTLNNPTPATGDRFGVSVAISGNVVVVGANRDDAGATDAGAAHVFDATTGALVTTLSNPAPTAFDGFGGAVAVSGNVAVIGTESDDAGATDAGTAYVLDATTGALVTTLSNPAPGLADHFGHSVAVSGNLAVAGAFEADAGATDAGTAYVFDATTGALAATLNKPAPTADDEFGVSVAISGNVVVVGANRDDAGATDAGAAYVFDATTGALVTTLSNPAPAASDGFGNSVAVSGTMAAVGAWFDDAGAVNAGSAYTFSCTPPTPSPTASPSASPSPSPTRSPSPSPSASPSASPTASPSASASPTISPTRSPTPSPSPSPSASPSASPTASPTPSASPSPTASPTESPTASPSPSPTSSPTAGPSPSPSASPTPTPPGTPNAARDWTLFE